MRAGEFCAEAVAGATLICYVRIQEGPGAWRQAHAQATAQATRRELEQRTESASKELRDAREENRALREQLGKLLEEAAAGRAATDGGPRTNLAHTSLRCSMQFQRCACADAATSRAAPDVVAQKLYSSFRQTPWVECGKLCS